MAKSIDDFVLQLDAELEALRQILHLVVMDAILKDAAPRKAIDDLFERASSRLDQLDEQPGTPFLVGRRVKTRQALEDFFAPLSRTIKR